ncbi:YraN family protein [Haliea sp. E17]|uniref:YraN family protein n=1 Tax=Haliea sp. E17 TaxID=3401576 RepID=UPI003AAF849F
MSSGDYYEVRAAQWLQARGLHILARNFRCRCGEIDLIARDRQHLVFVEVRARSNPRFVSAAASVDQRKQRRLLRSAQLFLQQHPQLARMPCRFDVIAFDPRQSVPDAQPHWIRAAFTS